MALVPTVSGVRVGFFENHNPKTCSEKKRDSLKKKFFKAPRIFSALRA